MKRTKLLVLIIFLLVVTAFGCSTGNATETVTTTGTITTTGTVTTTKTITTTTEEPENIIFADGNLEAAVKSALGKPADEEISIDELADLKILSASDRGITDISGIEYCVNLIVLNLSNNSIIDISYLATLTSLEVLDLKMNDIINISAISKLINLSWLDVQDNDIGDIWPLAYNSGLGEGDRLFLAGNVILYTEHEGPWQVAEELEDRGVILHISYSY